MKLPIKAAGDEIAGGSSNQPLGDFQYKFLRALQVLGADVSGKQIILWIEQQEKPEEVRINAGQIYSTRDPLLAAKLISSRQIAPPRGGRAVEVFTLTPEGEAQITRSVKHHLKMATYGEPKVG